MNKRILKYGVLFLVLVIILGAFIIYDNFNIETTEYIIETENVPESFDGFKIIHLSDLHNTQFGENNKNLLEIIYEENPDVVFITGDSIDRFNTDIDIPIKLIENILTTCDVYFIVGNHELSSDTDKYLKFIDTLTEMGVHVLQDNDAYIERNNEKIQIIGLNDADRYKITYGENYKQGIIDSINKMDNKNYYSILLSHHPELFPEYSETDVDLVFSGHAHGGQFRLPFIGGIIAPEQGLFPEYDAGVFTENDTTMVVSRGLGNSIIPVRITNSPEVVVVTLNKR